MFESLILGLIQGITEWLPVSSQGSVTALGSFFFDLTLAEAVSFALWLHVGTAFSAMVAFRVDLIDLAKTALRDPIHPSPLLRFAVVGTATSIGVGVPVILALDELSTAVGTGAMIIVGIAMLGTALALRARPAGGERTRDDLTLIDALGFGAAQGLAAIPGFSRSGLTVAMLLGRRFGRSEALVVSFIMGIPASLGAALFAGLDGDGIGLSDGLIGAATAAIIGFISIRSLLAVAHRINFSNFVGLVGVAIIAGGVAQVFF